MTAKTYDFTAADVKAKAIEIAEANPDFVYRDQDPASSYGCSYLGQSLDHPTEGQACLVGQALAQLGVSEEDLARFEGWEGARATVSALITGDKGALGYDDDAIWLQEAQNQQDSGLPWGEAIEWATQAA